MFALHLTRHFFLPHESNNQKARLLHSSSIFVLTLVIIAFSIFFRSGSVPKPAVLGFAANISVDEAIRLTNENRVANGLAPLQKNDQLTAAALEKGRHMLANNYWAHVAPDGTEPWNFFLEAGYRYRFAGENLARDFSSAPAAVEAWMASATHRDNLLSNRYREIGIAVVEGDLAGVDTTIVVQFFGTGIADKLPTNPVAQAKIEVEATPQATPEATPTPVPVVALVQNEPPGGQTSGAEEPQRVLISPFNVTKGISLGVVGLMLGVLIVDRSVVSKRRISRLGGRSFAHLAFFGMILAIVLVAKAGQIL